MENKIKEITENLFSKKGDKKLKILVAIGIIGIILVALSEAVPAQNKQSASSIYDDKVSYSEYIDMLEKETQDIISSIEGAGQCKVMITLKNTNESVYAKNTEEETGNGSYSKKDEYVLYDNSNSDSPLLIKQYFPEVQGVVIVCSGGDDVVVRENIIRSVTALYNVSSTKISVSKLKV